MDPLNIFFLILAGCAAIWQIGLGIAAIAILAKGNRVTSFGVGPGVLFVILLALGLFL